MSHTEQDPWLDTQFAPLAAVTPADELTDEKFVEGAATSEELEAIKRAEAANNPAPEPSPEPDKEPPVEPKEEVFEQEDGSSVTITPTETGLKATLDPGTGGGIEVFYGKDESELLRQVLPAKLNATKKIREQTRQLKLSVPKEVHPEVVTAKGHALSADEVFEIKNALASDPDKALDLWFQKKTGLSVDQLVKMAQDSRQAASDAVEIINIDTEARAFRELRPLYAATNDNQVLIFGWLAKNKLGKELTEDNRDEIIEQLIAKRFYNRNTLAEAYDDLASDGLLELNQAPSEPERVELEPPKKEPVKLVAPAPAQGIPEKRVGKRAAGAFGISARETVGVPTKPSDSAPSDEELDNMSTEDIDKLMSGVVRFRAQQSTRR